VVISHIGGETGQTGRLETLTVSVRQSSDTSPVLVDIPLSIAPLDNSAPQLVIGSHLVAEVDTPVSLGPDVISAEDQDTSPQRLTFFVTQTPTWGHLEKRSAPMSRRGSHLLLYILRLHGKVTVSHTGHASQSHRLIHLRVQWPREEG